MDSNGARSNQWMGKGGGTVVDALTVLATRSDHEVLDEAVRLVIADADRFGPTHAPGRAVVELVRSIPNSVWSSSQTRSPSVPLPALFVLL